MSEIGKQVRVKGQVKWFNDTKGFGFISCPGHNKDVFLHKSALIKSGLHSIKEGDKVTIVIVEMPKGAAASDIKMDR